MIVSITSIELKGPLKFFALSYNAMQIMRQMKTTNCLKMKKRGVWTKHYTMTLWENEDQMMAFVSSGAHLDAMKKSREMAKEIRVMHFEGSSLPNWKTALKHLENAKVIRY